MKIILIKKNMETTYCMGDDNYKEIEEFMDRQSKIARRRAKLRIE